LARTTHIELDTFLCACEAITVTQNIYQNRRVTEPGVTISLLLGASLYLIRCTALRIHTLEIVTTPGIVAIDLGITVVVDSIRADLWVPIVLDRAIWLGTVGKAIAIIIKTVKAGITFTFSSAQHAAVVNLINRAG
jgi:hypothetical protein